MSAHAAKQTVTTIGIDIGKNTFHVVGLDSRGEIVLRQKFSRGQVEVRLANMPPCRTLLALGHDAKLIPGQFVKPFLKSHAPETQETDPNR
jgi:transposase